MKTDKRWIERAALYEALALAFLYPGDVLAEALASGEFAEALAEIGALCDLPTDGLQAATDELATYKGRDSQDILHELRVEHTRLFVGAPTPEVSPYAGVWQAKRDGVEPLLFVSKEAMAVERFMRSCGVGQPKGTNEPLDHMGSELEFLQYLCLVRAEAVTTPPASAAAPTTKAATPPEGTDIPADAYERFYQEHFKTWAGEFAEATLSHATTPFYKSTAHILQLLF